MRIEGSSYIPSQSLGTVNRNKDTITGNKASSFPDLDEYVHEDESVIYSNRTYYRIEVIQSYERPDYSTMSDSEIYNAVIDEFKYKYGDDFLENRILCMTPSSYEEANMYFKFRAELEKQIGDSKKVRAVAREATYGNMTDEEIREAISQQYSQGTMTLRDFMHMSYEMQRVGVDVGTRQIAQLMHSDPNGRYMPGGQQEKNDYSMSIMDEPLNKGAVIMNLNGMRFANNRWVSELTTQFITNLFNNQTERNGNLFKNLVLRR